MSRNKSREKKEFLFAQREKIGKGFTGAPVWVMQKAGKRIWNKTSNRHWRRTKMGHLYKKLKGEL
jgi:ribosomal protein L39E